MATIVNEYVIITSGEAGPPGVQGDPGAPGAPGLDGTTAGRHTLWIPSYAMTPRLTDGAADHEEELATNFVMIKALDFDPDTDQYAQFMVSFPKSWDEGVVQAEFHWKGPAGAGDVVWALQGAARNDGEALDAAFGGAQFASDTFQGADIEHRTATTSGITVAGTPADGSLVVFQVARLASNGGDTYNQLATLLGVRLFFTTDAENDD